MQLETIAFRGFILLSTDLGVKHSGTRRTEVVWVAGAMQRKWSHCVCGFGFGFGGKLRRLDWAEAAVRARHGIASLARRSRQTIYADRNDDPTRTRLRKVMTQHAA